MNLDRCTPGQLEIITTLDAPLMVAAGAGSGKTFTLTQRIVNALSTGALTSIGEVLAITFTKKAAAELRSRIKAQLLSEGLTDEALAVDDAWITTIHQMASRMLRENALELGVDPTFEVISDSLADELRDEAIERVIKRAKDGGDRALQDLLASGPLTATGFGAEGTVDRARRLLARIEAMPAGFDGVVLAQPRETPGDLLRALFEPALEFRMIAETWKKPTKTEQAVIDELASAIEAAEAWLLSPASAVPFGDDSFDADAFRAAFYAFPPTTPQFHAKKDDAAFFEQWRSTYAHLSAEAEACVAARDADALVRLARMVAEETAALKGPSRLDKGDLLTLCARALRERPALAARYRDRFKLIMIDEFQDTDKLQVALVSAIARPGLSNVCTVGDAQQSIYRFRGADVNVFFEYRDALRAQGDRARFVSLPDNFRSHRDVLAVVDAIFSQQRVFGSEFLHLEPRAKLNDEPDPVCDRFPRIAFDFVHCKQSTSRTQGVAKGDAVRVAARHVARHFAELKERGAQAGDMALLLGGMTNADVYVRALREAGLESVVAGGSVFSTSAEAQLVACLLRVAVNRADEEALYTVLVSPLFALSDDALLALASQQGSDGAPRRRPLSACFIDDRPLGVAGLTPADEEAIGLARAVLRSFVIAARGTSASEALRRLLVDAGLLDRLEDAGVDGLAQAGNYAKALALVRSFEYDAAGIASVATAFAEHLRTAKEAPGSLATVSSDFVRIMTVHASKGLEFPHVAIADLRDGTARRDALLVENLGERTFVAFGAADTGAYEKKIAKLRGFGAFEEEVPAIEDAHTPGELYAALDAHMRGQTLSEAQRLFYVALTRASKTLLVSWCTTIDPAREYEGAGIYRDAYEVLQWDVSSKKTVSQCPYGGTLPARVSLVHLQTPDDLAEELAASCAAESASACGDAASMTSGAADAPAPAVFVVPQRERPSLPYASPRSFGREDVRSYSSLDHGTAEPTCACAAPAAPGAVASFDDEASDPQARVLRPDEGDATALGTAFHHLAQRAICALADQRGAADAGAAGEHGAAATAADGALTCPDAEAVAHQVASCALTPDQEARLQRALTRWFGSAEAAAFARHAHLDAEVPFMTALESDDGTVYLEGEIDGLAFDDDACAFLIDYKTGGTADETDDELHRKHLQQAQCYAYALMREGFSAVEASFVRVEQADPAQTDQPQVVRYRFTRDDVPALVRAILAAWS